jgi:hypothetical protein
VGDAVPAYGTGATVTGTVDAKLGLEGTVEEPTSPCGCVDPVGCITPGVRDGKATVTVGVLGSIDGTATVVVRAGVGALTVVKVVTADVGTTGSPGTVTVTVAMLGKGNGVTTIKAVVVIVVTCVTIGTGGFTTVDEAIMEVVVTV